MPSQRSSEARVAHLRETLSAKDPRSLVERPAPGTCLDAPAPAIHRDIRTATRVGNEGGAAAQANSLMTPTRYSLATLLPAERALIFPYLIKCQKQ